MKKLLTSMVVATLALSFALPANAAATKRSLTAQREASCKAQAANKFSAIHFIKRRNFVNDCMGRTEAKKVTSKPTIASKPSPTSSGQSTK